MEYLIGSITTFFIIIFVYFNVSASVRQNTTPTLRFSQSYRHYLISPYSAFSQAVLAVEEVKTQAMVHFDKVNLKIVLFEDQAYWIQDEAFYTADLLPDGKIDKLTQKVVDTMTMDPVQLNKIMIIVETLREGK
jgi:hypothetical protein